MNSAPRRPPYTRIVFAIIAILTTAVGIWGGLPLLAPVFLILSVVGLQEYAAMMELRNVRVRRRSLWVAATLTIPAALPAGVWNLPPSPTAVGWRELLLGLFAIYLIALEVARPSRNTMTTVVFTLFGYLYIPWAFSFMLSLRQTPDGTLGLWYLGLSFLAVIASDVGGYVFGTLFGRRKLAPAISPNKTLEGALGGLILAAVVVGAVAWGLRLWSGLDTGLANTLLFSVLVASVAQVGDLFESLIKRWAGVKDTGIFLPGHGGVLDRIDSSLLALPVAYFFLTLTVL